MTSAQTARTKARFLKHFAHTGNVTAACRAACVNRRNVYLWQEIDPEFEVRYRQAEVEAGELLEEEARRRAADGWLEPVFRQDGQVGEVRRYSDQLLLALLRARFPHKYGPRVDVRSELRATLDLTVTDARQALEANLSPDDLDDIARRLLGDLGEDASTGRSGYASPGHAD